MDGLVTFHKRRALKEATQRDSLEGIAGPSLTGLPPPCSSGTHKFGWCSGRCTDENCILGGRVHRMKDPGICSTKRGFFWSSDRGPSSPMRPHKRPPNTLGLEETHSAVEHRERFMCTWHLATVAMRLVHSGGSGLAPWMATRIRIPCSFSMDSTPGAGTMGLAKLHTSSCGDCCITSWASAPPAVT